MSDVKKTLREFVVENYLFGDDGGLEENTSFLDEGIIDSTGMLELIQFISETFEVTIQDDELVPENLDSINNVAAFVGRKAGQVAV